MNNCEEIKECIACGGTNLKPLLDLGEQPLANSFVRDPSEPEDKFPLATNYCGNCFHVQLTHKVNPDLLFKNYLYVSGTSKTQKEYFDWFARYVTENQRDAIRVLDIGCNDGSQLDAFKKYNWITYGVDPAENLYPISSKNHNVKCGYFDRSYPETMEGYDAVVCQNAFAHNYDQLEFLKNMARVLAHDGLIYITVSQSDMILNNEFDTIYHEHLSFYNIRSMESLCNRADLYINEVIRHPIHGTSYIFVITKEEKKSRNAYLLLLLENEKELGLYNEDTYETYAAECSYMIDDFADIREMARGHLLVGYGAPAKGNTLLNASKVKLDFIVDDNPLKQGLYTPGMHIEVCSPEVLKRYDDIDRIIFVPLAWNFYDEIKKKIKEIRPGKLDLFVKGIPNLYVES